MFTISRRYTWAQTAIAAVTILATPLPASLLWQPVENASRAAEALEAWQADISLALSQALSNASVARLMTPNSAIVRVLFSIGADGRAADIRLLEGNANWSARRAALFAIGKLEALDRVPVADPANTRFLAYLVFYRSEIVRVRLMNELRLREQERLAASGPEREYLAIGNF